MKQVNSTASRSSTTSPLSPSPRRLGVAAFVLGLLAFLGSVALARTLTLPADPTLTELVSEQYWLPIRVLDILAFVLVGYAVLQVLRVFYARGLHTLAVTAGATLAIGLALQIVEFAIAALAAPALLETDLTASEVALVLEAYRTLGVAILDVSFVFLGVTLLLVGGGAVRLYTRDEIDTTPEVAD